MGNKGLSVVLGPMSKLDDDELKELNEDGRVFGDDRAFFIISLGHSLLMGVI